MTYSGCKKKKKNIGSLNRNQNTQPRQQIARRLVARHPRETLHRQVSVTPDDDVVAPHDNKDMTRNQSCGALAFHHPPAYHPSTIFAFIGLVAEVVNRGGYNNGSVFYDHSTLTSELTDIALLILIL